MANQYVNKVIVNNEIKMDLTEDTVTPKTLRKGFTAHDASGAPIVGNESLTDISEDGTDAGPIAELTANGWANQTQLSGKNLWKSFTNKSSAGVTLTLYNDGSYVINGTATETVVINNVLQTPIPAGTYTISVNNSQASNTLNSTYLCVATASETIVSSGAPLNVVNSSKTFTVTEPITTLRIRIANGDTIDNLVIYPQLELGSTATEYEPYCGGIPSPNPNYPQEIRVARGRNLFNETLLLQINNWTVSNGVYSGNTQTVHGTFGNVFPTESFENGQYVASFDLVSNDTSKNSLAFVWYYTDNTNERLTCKSSTHYTFISNASKNVDHIALSHNSNVDISLSHFQLEKGSIATPYVPYGFVRVEIQGKNLLENMASSQTVNGVTFTVNDDRSINVKGTATSRAVLYLWREKNVPIKTGTYIVNLGTSDVKCGYHTYDNGWLTKTNTPVGLSGIFTDFWIDVAEGKTVDTIVYPQLELGSEATEYEPYYHKTIPVPLPERGWVGGLPDGTSDILKLNTAGKYEWVENTNEVVFDGTTVKTNGAVNTGANVKRYYHVLSEDVVFVDNSTLPNVYSTHFVQCTPNQSWTTTDNGVSIAGNGKQLTFINTDIDSSVADAFNAWLASNPITVLYPLANPTTEQGYVPNWDNTLPEHCTIDIPELRDISVRYYLDTASVEPAQRYYERANAELNQVIDDASNDATLEALAAIAPIEGDISSANYLVGAYLIHDNQLCEVTTPIATGEAITVGTNVVISSVATELGEIQVAVQDIIDDPYILPTMSASEKGGAKVGQGLRIDDDILSVDMSSDDATDAGPLISLQAEGWAEQEQYLGVNLLPFPYAGEDITDYGVTVTVNDDQSVTFSGSFTGSTTDSIKWPWYGEAGATNNLITPAGATAIKYITVEDKHSNNRMVVMKFYDSSGNELVSYSGLQNDTSYSIPSNASGMYVYEMITKLSNTGLLPFTASIMLSAGTTTYPYEPYIGGVASPSPELPQEIKVARGRNLLDLNALASKTINGVTFTVNNDGSITIDGTADANAIFDVIPITPTGWLDYIGNVTVSMNSATLPSGAYYAYTDGVPSGTATGHGFQSNATFMLSESNVLKRIYIYVPSGTTVNNLTCYPQLELGSVATPYVPYGCVGVDVTYDGTTTTIPIPLPSKGFAAALPDGTSDILRLDGAGKWEWESKTGMLDLAQLTWQYYVSTSSTLAPFFYTRLTSNDIVAYDGNFSNVVYPALAEDFVFTRRYAPLFTDRRIVFDGTVAMGYVSQIQCKMTDITTVADFMTALGDSSLLLYKAASPTTEQGYLDNWDNNIPLHATIDIPELRNIGVECYMDEQASTLNTQWSERLRSEMDGTATNAVTESLASLAPVENDISSANYSTGSYLIHNNQLYKVTTAIATGEAISTNTNIAPATIANELLDIDSDLLDFSELLEAAKAEYREKFQAIDSWQAAASQLIREDNGYYSNESITRMLAQRFDGKLYGYSEPKTTAVAITKTGANAGLANPTLGTATVAGSSAYRHLGPFQWFAAKGIVDSNGVPHVSTIKGIDSDADWNADTNNVWSLRPIQWYSIDSTGGTVIGSLSDTWHLGLKPNPQAYLPDGTLRPYMLAPRYALGFENGVGVSKSGFKGYGRDVSHNSLITKLDYANTGYSGKTIYENWYDIFMSRMIYGTKDFQTIMQGCTSYNYQYHPSVAEQDTTRVILSNANAANLVVGSTMMMGNQATESTDRNNVNVYNIFDGLIIESITEYDANNKSIELATNTTFNTDPAYLFSTAPWHSGSCDTMDWDGSPTNPQSAKECAFFQGCELMTGTYEVSANIIIKSEENARQIPYIVHSSRDDATSVTANFIKCGDGLLSNDGTANAWKYPLYIADHNGLLYGEEVGGSTTAGCADGQYVRPDSTASDSEWLSVGNLWYGRYAGLSCVYADGGLGSSYWSFWSRLSPVGLSRG